MADTAQSVDEALAKIREAPTASCRDLGIDLKALERGLPGLSLQDSLIGFSYLARQESEAPKGIMALPIRVAEAVDKAGKWHGTWGFMGLLFVLMVLAIAWGFAGG